MLTPDEAALRAAILSRVPGDGSTIGNLALSRAIAEQLGSGFDAAAFEVARQALLINGTLVKGAGRGGSVRRAAPTQALQDLADGDDFELQAQVAPPQMAPAASQPSAKRAAATPSAAPSGASQVISYRHKDKRKNNPQVGLVNEASDPPQPKTTWAYDPHLDPALQFDVGRAGVEGLIDDALARGDEAAMRAALECLRKQSAPYLAWTGKAERTSFEVDTVSLHVHERIDPASILAAVRKRLNDTKAGKAQPPAQMGLFSAPFEDVPLRDAIDFYKHERGWSNRLVAGDSLLVMNSLLQKEGMAGRVQMIYIDPPYGIKYGSNFQPFVNQRNVSDGKDQDLTQEPEMIKAFRDTWELGIHSYLTYLRDRLLLARELLTETGSLFVQISDENLHHVREVIDEIFGAENCVATIAFRKTAGQTTKHLPGTCDYIVWFAKDESALKYRPIYRVRSEGEDDAYALLELASGQRRRMFTREQDNPATRPAESRSFQQISLQSERGGRPSGPGSAMYFDVTVDGRTFQPSGSRGWTTTQSGINRLLLARRIAPAGNTPRYVRYFGDFPGVEFSNLWTDTQSGSAMDKVYVVQTNQRVIERCMLMTTDPGDLVLDPTCGSGTTAFVAEKWGRRWITCDTSRVAVTLAKQRLMTASFDYYELAYPNEGLRGGFIYKTVPHVKLGSIANNADIDAIYERLHPAIESALTVLSAVLNANPPAEPLGVTEGVRKGSKLVFAKKKPETLAEWEVPFDLPDTWPESVRPAFDAFHAARQSMQRAMDRSIADRAESETLYDQPRIAKDKLRISGPFTVEAVPYPSVLSLDEAEQPQEADVAIARSGESARQHGWRDELLKTGIRGKGGQLLRFTSLETVPGTACVHASGSLETGERVVVSFGPEHGALEQRQVEHAIREAGELFPLPKMIVFCAFAFDPEAAKDIDAFKGITALKAQMNTDLLTEDLKKARSSNQSFWLMGQPDVDVRPRADGLYEVEVNGFDYFDTVKGELISGGKAKIAMWSLDTDYDDRSLFPRQVFFPMAGKDEGWMKLKKSIRAELDEAQLMQFHGTVSLPFAKGDNAKVAVKIVDDRGIESLKIVKLG
ncbi:MAG: site-specific DNA-methyltransferase [Burkholderiaceae bacterium]|nr:site-specific DNA-methyltransferase [Burkholderiaceae bacterium]